MWLWELKKSCLPYKEVRQVTFGFIESTEPLPIIDWKWECEKFLALVHEVGWLACDLPQNDDTEETIRELLSLRWIAAQYADLAYFNINHVTKGALDS